ncbi:MAG: hypothetical protein EOS76_04665 [Mesorhizobium sp.]|uniref:hypothetical protein n=1 Tax=unclassified Mesorhizobium TaxID=325217 RepID=UPI000F763C42|nr:MULTISPECIES: hypothetical protein [unclassified Mesorhizobium]AZO34807.1 hypothetical protein EJ072_10365 [Mesorhizobium sp. M2A.F.Ca.ET.046.03.2.1]RVC82595.1 hypothetical protein EN766_00645 [Mesorhizobium sp. M2A.F.Ca.ET.046.02.1.1]RWE21434.1 MAG: hypothetical protein EOS76_04665 [Mesorhizobium sp.]
MNLTVLTDDMDIGVALLAADSSAEKKDTREIVKLNADLSVSAAIAFTLKSVAAMPVLAKKLTSAIASVTVPKPKAHVVLKGPFGEIALEIGNVSEDNLIGAMEKVFNIYREKTDSTSKDMRKKHTIKSKRTRTDK